MNTKTSRKGFTIVELVIVIAVIGILAGVLIPTFASVATKAKDSAALQEATSAYSVLLIDEEGALDSDKTYYIAVDNDSNGTADYWFVVNEAKLEKPDNAPNASDLTEYTWNDEAVKNDLSSKVKIYTKAN